MTNTPDTYHWDFGDGTTDITSGAKPTHVYKDPGTYTVTLSEACINNCQNPSGGYLTVSHDVTVVPGGDSPVNVVPPEMSGAVAQGQTLSVDSGTWLPSVASYSSGVPSIAYSYQWQQCDASGNNCSAIAGATSSSYTLQASDVGATIDALVTATDAGGSTSANAGTTDVVPALASLDTTGSFSCVAVPADAPAAPPLPATATQDAIDAGLASAVPLCPTGQAPQPVETFEAKVAPLTGESSDTSGGTDTSDTPDGSVLPDTSDSPTYASTVKGGKYCQLYKGGGYYCHDIEEKDNTSGSAMYARMGRYGPAMSSSETQAGSHSISQLWAIQGNSTLELGWTVDPSRTNDGNTPHLFEYHTGDNYGAGSCYNGCGFHGAANAPVVPSFGAKGAILSDGAEVRFGVKIDNNTGYDWFYYGGHWIGYIKQGDRHWHGHPVTKITTAELGGEVASYHKCPQVQMGNGQWGTSPGGGLIDSASINEGSGLTTLKPDFYFEEGYHVYNLGYKNSNGGFQYGGPEC